MKIRLACSIAALALTIAGSATAATTYQGNTNSGFGGPIGKGSLTLTDDGAVITGTITKGTGGLNDVLVIYIDNGSASGILGTTNFTDGADGLRKAISGFNGVTNRSTLAFPTGFQPAYAVALGPASDNFGGLWQLVENGGNNSLPFLTTVNLTPTGTSTAATYTFSVNVGDIGLSPSSGATIKILGTYISNSGYRSDEAVAGNVTGTQGWNPFNTIYSTNYTIRTASQTPPQITGVFPPNNTAYVQNTNVAFTVTSLLSGVQTNKIKLTLNGIAHTNLTFTGNANSWQVADTAKLQTNLSYTAVITATDIDNNSTTNNFTFNTWYPGNPFIEAEDYNYGKGTFINNFANIPPDDHNLYAGATGSNGVDFLEHDLSGANNAWRTDLPQVEAATDIDHNYFADKGYTDYDLSFIENGEWENYTRRMSNDTYAVYARMAAFGNNATMLMERHANATATSSNQPRAALGTFVSPNTGGAQNWNFVQLKDFFSNPVLVRNAGTNTFRLTCVGGSQTYNNNYLIFVPSTDTNQLKPYISAGFPFPGAGNVEPDQGISFTIANTTSSVSPNSIRLFVNGPEVTGNLSLSNNTAGSVVTYQPTNFYPLGSTVSIEARFTNNFVSVTNQWQFTVANIQTIPTSYVIPGAFGVSNGFLLHIVKATNGAPAAQFPPSSARAEAQLAGLITNADTMQPWPNEAAGPNGNGMYAELGVINYEQCGLPSQDGDTFTNNATFPYVDLGPYAAFGCSNTNGPDFISMSINTYIFLQPGIYRWAVRSDDGFRLTTGTGLVPTNTLVIDYEGGRSSANPSLFEFIVEQAGLYPFRLLYYEGQFGASIEWYSINRSTGQPILINDLTNPNATLAFRSSSAITILNPAHAGANSTFQFQTSVGRTHIVQYKNALTDATWQTLKTVTGNGLVTNITDNTASGATRFYRVNTPQ